MLPKPFFDQDASDLAIALLGKVLRRRIVDPMLGSVWISARIIETEAYYVTEKASHSSLGFTEKRKAVFMSPGTIYMYYARGGDSLNFSARGSGNAVLIKSAYPYFDRKSPPGNIAVMQRLNPPAGASSADGHHQRPLGKLCAGQTLLCKALDLKVPEWNQRQLQRRVFEIDEVKPSPGRIIQCRRLGIPEGRDHELKLRYVDADYANTCTSDPLSKRTWVEGTDYRFITTDSDR